MLSSTPGSNWPRRLLLLAQLATTIIILTLPVPNTVKLVALLILWLITFWPLQRSDYVLFLIAAIFFTLMNVMSLKQGLFWFTQPDLFGLPAYEFAMWGFYLLHVRRMISLPAPPAVRRPIIVLVLGYSAAFALLSNQQALLYTTLALLIAGLSLYHDKADLAFTLYMIFVGACIEYAGTAFGLWQYASAPAGGVPLWFVTLWGGVGFFLNRLVRPLLQRVDAKILASAPG